MSRNNKTNSIIAKLVSYDENQKERPYYRLQAHSTDKEKGIMMINYLKNLFSINGNQIKKSEKKDLKEQEKIQWTRDEKGNIISKWSIKNKNKENAK